MTDKSKSHTKAKFINADRQTETDRLIDTDQQTLRQTERQTKRQSQQTDNDK